MITPTTEAEATIQKIQHLKDLDEQVKVIDDAMTSIEHIRSNYKDYNTVVIENGPFENSIKFKVPLSVSIDVVDRLHNYYESQRRKLLQEASELLR